MKMTKFHHLHIVCNDLNQMVGFFVNTLHASLLERKQFDGVDGAKLDFGGTTLNLSLPSQDGQISRENSLRGGYDHIGIQVEDLDKTCKELKWQGYVFDMEPVRSGKIVKAFFRGPEDLRIELLQIVQ